MNAAGEPNRVTFFDHRKTISQPNWRCQMSRAGPRISNSAGGTHRAALTGLTKSRAKGVRHPQWSDDCFPAVNTAANNLSAQLVTRIAV
jgi:hypothetical protein